MSLPSCLSPPPSSDRRHTAPSSSSLPPTSCFFFFPTHCTYVHHTAARRHTTCHCAHLLRQPLAPFSTSAAKEAAAAAAAAAVVPCGRKWEKEKMRLDKCSVLFSFLRVCLFPPKGKRLTLHFFPLVMCKCTAEERIPGIVGGSLESLLRAILRD